MRNIFYGIFLLVIGIIIASCKKNESDNIETDPIILKGLIKSSYSMTDNYNSTFEYNSQRKLVKKSLYIGNQITAWIVFKYNESYIVSMNFDSSSLGQIGSDTLFLNDRGLVYLRNNYSEFHGNYSYLWSNEYEYDNDNYLIKESFKYIYPLNPCVSSSYITIFNHNPTYSKGVDNCLPEDSSFSTCSFYTDNINTLDNDNQGQSYLGKTSLNPRKQRVGIKNNDTIYIFTHQYTFNSVGFIVSSQVEQKINNQTVNYTVNYEYY
jgi:hypothetical protein